MHYSPIDHSDKKGDTYFSPASLPEKVAVPFAKFIILNFPAAFSKAASIVLHPRSSGPSMGARIPVLLLGITPSFEEVMSFVSLK